MAAHPDEPSMQVIGGLWAGHQKTRRTDMDKHARRQYFDRLCVLRDAYSELGPDDTTSVISIDEMIERAMALLDQPASPLIATLDQRDTAN
jgi:hypothetical protein